VFEGIFVKGKKNGPGSLRYPDGKFLEGTWKNNEISERWQDEKLRI
jgi:hypothetical protein